MFSSILKILITLIATAVLFAGLSSAQAQDNDLGEDALLTTLILEGPWEGEDGRIWTFTTSTIYERPADSDGAFCIIPISLDGERLSGQVWFAHDGNYQNAVEALIGRYVVGSLRLDGSTLYADGQSWVPLRQTQLASDLELSTAG